ncbi:MFS transporter [Paenibacillus amylolyticus]|nr:MFS transporter [Paenibacillus amylolyticus]
MISVHLLLEKLWILNGYSLVMAGLLPAMGTLRDRLGHKKIFTLGLLVFSAASLAAAFSPVPAVLVMSRILLAVGASMMMPATLSIIRVTFTNERELALAIGIWGSIASGGAGLGPIVGGLLLQHFWWGSVFLINLPIAILAFVFALKMIPKHHGDASKKWDFTSSIQIMIAMVGIIYSIKEFTRREGSLTLAIIAAVIGLLSLIIFIRRQNNSPNPLLDLSLFKIPRFSTGFITALVGLFAQMGVQYMVTQRLQLVEGMSPLQAGLFTVSIPVAALIAGPVTGGHYAPCGCCIYQKLHSLHRCSWHGYVSDVFQCWVHWANYRFGTAWCRSWIRHDRCITFHYELCPTSQSGYGSIH